MPALETIVLLSGGIESTTLLHTESTAAPGSVRALTVRANLLSEPQQMHFAKMNAFVRGVPHDVYDMRGIHDLMSIFYPIQWTAVDEHDGPCPEELSALGVAISGATYFAQMAGAKRVVVGLTKEQERKGTRSFFGQIGMVLSLYDDAAPQVSVEAPYLGMTKAEVVKSGLDAGMDYSQTWSCYYAHAEHCGVCRGCINRKDAFKGVGQPDPTTYLTP